MSLDLSRASVIGAGRSGIAAANALAARGADVLLLERQGDRPRPATLDARVAYRAGSQEIREGDLAVLSPGIPEHAPIREEAAARASAVIGEVELFFILLREKHPAVPVVAITGTDGKSTVTTMVGEIVAASGRPTFVGGNLGNPLCEGLEEIGPEHVVVGEISAFQLTTCHRFRPNIAAVTNIAEDHIDYHGSFEAYVKAKRRVYQAMGEGDVLILNADDIEIAAWPQPEGPQVQYFSLLAPREAHVSRLETGELQLSLSTRSGQPIPLMTRGALPLLGEHNTKNALLAGQVALMLGVGIETIAAALAAYRPLAHRLEPIPTQDGVRWINDSKATSPHASLAALNAIDGPLWILLGGANKDLDFQGLADKISERGARALCFGQAGPALMEALAGDAKARRVDSLADAVALASREAVAGETVLLSPACASFDAYSGFEARGEHFRALVEELGSRC